MLQPILVRPGAEGRYQLIAGERRWRASKIAGLRQVPAIIEEIDDDTALEIAIIENLQREDLSPLDEALMYERMTTDHGYSLRKLAQKLGKDKGYIENRLRLADAPVEIKQLVSLRKDTLVACLRAAQGHGRPKKRRRLAEQVARGELSLVKLRERIDGRPPREVSPDDDSPADPPAETEAGADAGSRARRVDACGLACRTPRSVSPTRWTTWRWRCVSATPCAAHRTPTARTSPST